MQHNQPPRSVKPIVPSASARYPSTVHPLQEHSIPLGDRRVHCAVGPNNGTPLVLFHGVTRCGRDFEPLLSGLLPRWHVHAPDHRGHGRSSRQGPYRIVEFAADAVAFLDATISQPCVVIGHSLGAMVAAMVAAQRPRQVRALVLEDPPGTTLAGRIGQSRFHLQFTNIERLLAETPDVERLTRALAEMPVQHPADGSVVRFGELRALPALRFGAECLLQMDPAVLTPLLAGRWLEGLDWFAALPAIACPTLLLRADPDCGGMLDADEATQMASLIPRCTRIELRGAGHSIHSTQPERMLELLTRFLEPHEVSPGVQP